DSLFQVGLGVDQVNGLTDAIDRLVNPTMIDRVQDFGGSVRGIFGEGTTARTEVEAQFDAIGQSLALMVQSGNAERAASMFADLEAQRVAAGGSVEDLTRLMAPYTDALAGAASEAELTGRAQSGLADEYRITADAIDQQAMALSEVIDLQREHAGLTLSERDAQRRFEAAVDSATEALKENGATLDV